MRNTTISCAGLLLVCASGLMAATAETIPFLTLLQPANEVPAITDTSLGNVIIWLHIVRDNSGAITSGSVDFDVSTKFSSAVTVTGLHIHNGPAGVNAGIVIPTDLNATSNSLSIDSTGKTNIFKQVQYPQTTPALPVSIIQDMIANPQNFYTNIHTTDHPSGAMRGQLLRAEMKVLMAMMSTNNEVPPTTPGPSGIATVTAMRALDSTGKVAIAEAIFHIEYTGFDPGTIFTGFHVHNGLAGTNGPVVINSGIGSGAASVAADPSGTGNLTYEIPVAPTDASFATEVGTINGMFATPSNHYINIHSTVFGGGVMRDQLKTTERAEFQVNLDPANEVPAVTGLAVSGQTSIPIYLLRNADGTVAAGTIIFDVNYRGFPAGTTITGLHIHQGPAGVAAGIVFPTDVNATTNKVVTDTGNGNIFKIVTISTPTAIKALNQLVVDPSGFYANLHTTVNGSGAMRSQLTAVPDKPVVNAVLAVSSLADATTTAPGGIVAIYGTSLATYASDLGGFNQATALVTSMNGVTATVGGVKAPLYYVGPGQINVQVPFEVTAGSQPVVVTSAGGTSVARNVTVAAVAPRIFTDSTGTLGTVVKNSDFSLITSTNPVKVGDTIVIYSTGLGQTTPAVQTGVLVVPPSATAFNNTSNVSVTIGGQTAPLVYSIASPGSTGLYQTAVTVPSGVTGTAKLVLSSGATASNSVNIAVQ